MTSMRPTGGLGQEFKANYARQGQELKATVNKLAGELIPYDVKDPKDSYGSVESNPQRQPDLVPFAGTVVVNCLRTDNFMVYAAELDYDQQSNEPRALNAEIVEDPRGYVHRTLTMETIKGNHVYTDSARPGMTYTETPDGWYINDSFGHE